jgi:hypothetical protein
MKILPCGSNPGPRELLRFVSWAKVQASVSTNVSEFKKFQSRVSDLNGLPGETYENGIVNRMCSTPERVRTLPSAQIDLCMHNRTPYEAIRSSTKPTRKRVLGIMACPIVQLTGDQIDIAF